MIFEELKVGDKFIFDYDIENEEEDNFRPVFMKTEKYYYYQYYKYYAVTLTGKDKGAFIEVGKYDSVIPIE